MINLPTKSPQTDKTLQLLRAQQIDMYFYNGSQIEAACPHAEQQQPPPRPQGKRKFHPSSSLVMDSTSGPAKRARTAQLTGLEPQAQHATITSSTFSERPTRLT